MKTRIIYVVIAVLLIATISCKSEASLQRYYIDNQSSKNFVSLDVPASIISLKEDASPASKEALKSLHKLNILAFVKNETNVLEFKAEQKKVKAILKDKKYTELMRMKDKGKSLTIKYQGDEDDDTVDEVYLYVSDKNQGFALVRVLGDNMKTEGISVLIKNIKEFDKNNEPLKELSNLLKDL